MSVFHPQFKTRVSRIEYDFSERTGHVVMDAGCCTDMSGTIEFFQKIDPKVKFIVTWAEHVADTTYRKRGAKWTAWLGKPE